jgi:hypothetical protein
MPSAVTGKLFKLTTPHEIYTYNLKINTLYIEMRTASVVWWSEFLATDPEARVRFPALSHFLRSSGSVTGSTQPREYN